MKRILKKILKISPYRRYCYGQLGEDLIIFSIFKNLLKIKKPTYIDIGAHHPYYLNNTALLYEKGCSGINIEPDTSLIEVFKKERKRDKNLNIGIGKENGSATLFIMESKTLNTLSEDEALRYEKDENIKIKERKEIAVFTFDKVLEKYNKGICPDFLSIDIEGYEMEVLKTINFKLNFPKVICVETISYSSHGNSKKNFKIINFLEDRGYFHYADTMINSIFVKKDLIKDVIKW